MPAAPDDDVTRFIRLMTWARDKGFRIGPFVECGTIKAQIADIRQSKGDLHTPIEPEATVMEEYGAKDQPVEGTMG